MRHELRFRAPALAACSTAAILALSTSALAGSFERVATWSVFDNLPADADKATETAAEILSVSKDGRTLIYTDSPRGVLGFVDISLAASPRAMGTVDLGGEPTSVAVAGHFALAGVNTSASFVNPSGHVAVVDIAKQRVRNTCDVGGQPDSVAVSPDGAYLAVAIENERDEDLNGGVIPQLPAGHLAILDLAPDGTPTNCNDARIVSLENLATYASSDPEPEYVSINSLNEAVVTLQENNHIAIVDLASGTVKKHFTAGTVSLDRIDAKTDKILSFDGSIMDVAREPDAVAWIDDVRFVTADEGDYTGGSRTFTIFDKEHWVAWSSGASLEHLIARIGHYPEKRAGKKGAEPEGAAVGSYDGETLMFIGAERANAVAVYRDRGAGMAPELIQALPTGSGPEGILPIPGRRLLAVAAEADSAEDGVRSNISLYVHGEWTPSYPMIVSEADSAGNGAPIGWGALSGLAGNPTDPYILYAVPDSFYANSRIYTMDVSGHPARIVAQRPLNKEGAPVSYDLEGIAVASDGGFWLVSEGNPDKNLSNLLIKTGADGTVEREIALPASVDSQAVRFGFEGVASVGTGSDEKVLVAFQREWKDNAKGEVRIGVYSPATESWGFMLYPLDAPESPAGGWVGLSEITALSDNEFMVIERDNRGGPDAAIKRIYAFSTTGLTPAAAGQVAPVVKKRLVRDVLPEMAGAHGWVLDKLEGLAIAADGSVYAVTDNDGIDDATGETRLLRLGKGPQVVARN